MADIKNVPRAETAGAARTCRALPALLTHIPVQVEIGRRAFEFGVCHLPLMSEGFE